MAPFYACGPDNDDFSFHFISSLRLNLALKTVAEEFSDRPKKEVWQQTSWTAHLGDVDLVLINSGAWWVDVNLFKVKRTCKICARHITIKRWEDVQLHSLLTYLRLSHLYLS